MAGTPAAATAPTLAAPFNAAAFFRLARTQPGWLRPLDAGYVKTRIARDLGVNPTSFQLAATGDRAPSREIRKAVTDYAAKVYGRPVTEAEFFTDARPETVRPEQ